MIDRAAWLSYRSLVLHDFADEFKSGFFLSYFRSFGVPELSATLVDRGGIERNPSKRSFDTAIIIYELISDGVDGPRGQAMVDVLKRAHKGVPGSPDDYLYVLLTLLIVPVEHVNTFSRRRLTPQEHESAFRFFMDLGEHMGIESHLTSYAEAEAFFRDYERERVAASAAGRHLFQLTFDLYLDHLPKPVRPLGARLLSALFNDKVISEILGLPVPSRLFATSVRCALRLKSRLSWLAHRGRNSAPAFVPGEPIRTYPDGYSIDDIDTFRAPYGK